jgi:tubulin polyglutamylase TTLL1/tubulin monoglycylase TTLL3/8
MTDTYRAVYSIIDPHKRLYSFEIFGFDFMIDAEFKVYLIEVNTNPCLESSSLLLGLLIPNMVENSLR